jgi:hypothetical protein
MVKHHAMLQAIEQFRQHRTLAADVLPRLIPSHNGFTGYRRSRQSVYVDRILCTAWNEGRLKRAKRLLEQGQTPPAIQLAAYKLYEQTWYTVSDGIHRTVSYREAGRKRILAHVAGYEICVPDRFRLVQQLGQTCLIQIVRSENGTVVETLMKERAIAPDLSALLLKIGVRHENQIVGFSINSTESRLTQYTHHRTLT